MENDFFGCSSFEVDFDDTNWEREIWDSLEVAGIPEENLEVPFIDDCCCEAISSRPNVKNVVLEFTGCDSDDFSTPLGTTISRLQWLTGMLGRKVTKVSLSSRRCSEIDRLDDGHSLQDYFGALYFSVI